MRTEILARIGATDACISLLSKPKTMAPTTTDTRHLHLQFVVKQVVDQSSWSRLGEGPIGALQECLMVPGDSREWSELIGAGDADALQDQHHVLLPHVREGLEVERAAKEAQRALETQCRATILHYRRVQAGRVHEELERHSANLVHETIAAFAHLPREALLQAILHHCQLTTMAVGNDDGQDARYVQYARPSGCNREEGNYPCLLGALLQGGSPTSASSSCLGGLFLQLSEYLRRFGWPVSQAERTGLALVLQQALGSLHHHRQPNGQLLAGVERTLQSLLSTHPCSHYLHAFFDTSHAKKNSNGSNGSGGALVIEGLRSHWASDHHPLVIAARIGQAESAYSNTGTTSINGSGGGARMALHWSQPALAGAIKALGRSHPWSRHLITRMSQWQAEQGRWEEAATFLLDAIRSYKEHGPIPPNPLLAHPTKQQQHDSGGETGLAELLLQLARIKERQEDLQGALEAAQEALLLSVNKNGNNASICWTLLETVVRLALSLYGSHCPDSIVIGTSNVKAGVAAFGALHRPLPMLTNEARTLLHTALVCYERMYIMNKALIARPLVACHLRLTQGSQRILLDSCLRPPSSVVKSESNAVLQQALSNLPDNLPIIIAEAVKSGGRADMHTMIAFTES